MTSVSWRQAEPRKAGLSFLPLIVALSLIGGAGAAFALVLDAVGFPDKRLHAVCDQVVQHLLVTHDPVELERARILVNTLGCDVTRRVDRWPAARTGGLVP